MLVDDRLPLLLALGLAVAQHHGAALVLDGLEQDLHLVARLGGDDVAGGVVEPFAQLDHALALVADVHPDLVAGDV
ncbi:MAG: hypothetical protein ACJ8FY_06125, partial [Gemmataceae bacterium]